MIPCLPEASVRELREAHGYGSRAKGNSCPASDIDLCLDAPDLLDQIDRVGIPLLKER